MSSFISKLFVDIRSAFVRMVTCNCTGQLYSFSELHVAISHSIKGNNTIYIYI